MPTPAVHIAAAIIIGGAIVFRKKEFNWRDSVVWPAFWGCFADMDGPLGLVLYNNWKAFHRGESHSLLAGGIVTILYFLFYNRRKIKPKISALAVFLMYSSHTILDGTEYGFDTVSVFYPFELYKSSVVVTWQELIAYQQIRSQKDIVISIICVLAIIIFFLIKQACAVSKINEVQVVDTK